MERDEFAADAERRAGSTPRQMTEVEGLTLREAVEWCGEELSVREATRLRQLADTAEQGESPPSMPTKRRLPRRSEGCVPGTAAG